MISLRNPFFLIGKVTSSDGPAPTTNTKEFLPRPDHSEGTPDNKYPGKFLKT